MCPFQSNRPSMRPTGMVETGNTSCNETEVGNASNCESSALHQVIGSNFPLRTELDKDLILFTEQNVARRSSIALSKYAHESAREDASIQLLHKELQDLYDQIAQRDENIAQQYTAINELRLKLDSRDIDSVMLVSVFLFFQQVLYQRVYCKCFFFLSSRTFWPPSSAYTKRSSSSATNRQRHQQRPTNLLPVYFPMPYRMFKQKLLFQVLHCLNGSQTMSSQ